MRSVILSLVFAPLALAAVVPGVSGRVNYAGYKGLRLTAPEGGLLLKEEQINHLAAHVLNPSELDYWDIVVAPTHVNAVTALVPDAKIIVEDVGLLLADTEDLESTYDVPSESWFTAYHSYADHIRFLDDLQGGFNRSSEIVTAGSSVQGRPLTGIHIWGSGGKGSKPAVLFHGTVHAREWISTMTTEYFAWQLLTKYATDPVVKALVDKFDFYIMPIVNPDGFVYTQTSDRLWRKNRQTVSGSTCIGRDNNRNWSYKWEVTGGASTNPCSETFKGRAPADSPETQGLISQVNKLRDSRGIRFYVDFHSYGQYILWPFGYNCSYIAPDDRALNALASTGASAIKSASGTSYTIGNSCRGLYATTGDSIDYVHAIGNSTYTYTIELRDTGTYGFVLPARQIKPTVTETWEGVIAMLRRV